MKKFAGFTLIEILVVMLIISIVTTVALLSIGKNQNREVQNFANELTGLLSLAQEQALLRPGVLGVAIKPQEYAFYIYKPAHENKKAKWLLLKDDKNLKPHLIPDDVEIKVEAENKKNKGPQIILSANGDSTPFAIYVGQQGHSPRYLIRGESDGSIENSRINTD